MFGFFFFGGGVGGDKLRWKEAVKVTVELKNSKIVLTDINIG